MCVSIYFPVLGFVVRVLEKQVRPPLFVPPCRSLLPNVLGRLVCSVTCRLGDSVPCSLPKSVFPTRDIQPLRLDSDLELYKPLLSNPIGKGKGSP